MTAFASGSRLGTYEMLSALGAGGMAEVYRAKDTKLGRDVALKILLASFTNPAYVRVHESGSSAALFCGRRSAGAATI
jgi:serine/threonine protein kinase